MNIPEGYRFLNEAEQSEWDKLGLHINLMKEKIRRIDLQLALGQQEKKEVLAQLTILDHQTINLKKTLGSNLDEDFTIVNNRVCVRERQKEVSANGNILVHTQYPTTKTEGVLNG